MAELKLDGLFPIEMTINEFKKWYKENKEAIHKLDTRYVNHHIIIVDDKGNKYKYARTKDEGRIIPRESLKSRRQLTDDVEKLKTLYKQLEFMEDKLRDYGDLLVMKGLDVEEEQQTKELAEKSTKTEFVDFGPV